MKAFPNPNNTDQEGMELRDYFAAMALQGLIAGHQAIDGYSCAVAAYRAYSFANAMMEVRDETYE